MSDEEDQMDVAGCAANAAPYVLGALTDEEHEAFRRHLGSCAICREEVAALKAVAAALPAVAPRLTAPPELKRRVMAAVHEDARAMPNVAPGARRRRVPGAGRGWRAALGWRPALGGLAVAAAAIVLAVISLAGGGGSSGGGSPATRVIHAEVQAPRASAVLRLAGGRAWMTIAGLPQSPAGRIYQVWLKGSHGPQPTDALFTVSARGDATVGVPGVVKGVREVMVTAEPVGGSAYPTSPPVIVARLG